MIFRISRTFAYVAASIVVFGMPAASASAQPLPDPRALLAKYAKATNAAKLVNISGYRVKGTFEYPAAGMTGVLEIFRDSHGRYLQVVNLPGFGEMKEGIDTAFKWSMNAAEGPKVTEGQEFLEARERVDPRASLRDPSLVIGAEAIERTTVDSEPCVRLKLTWKSGRVTNDCYNETTGLLVSSQSTETTSMGKIDVVTIFKDYKTFDGITMSTKVIQRAMNTELVQKMTDVAFESVDPSKFALPPEIQALRKK